MSTTKKRRGRPKGTGIDDRVPLLRIAALMAENPGLKPTTAIRRLGITEPSVIRRLRDKYKVFSQEQLSQKHAPESLSVIRERALVATSLRSDQSGLTQSAEITGFRAGLLPATDIGQCRGFSPDVQNLVPEIRL